MPHTFSATRRSTRQPRHIWGIDLELLPQASQLKIGLKMIIQFIFAKEADKNHMQVSGRNLFDAFIKSSPVARKLRWARCVPKIRHFYDRWCLLSISSSYTSIRASLPCTILYPMAIWGWSRSGGDSRFMQREREREPLVSSYLSVYMRHDTRSWLFKRLRAFRAI